MELSDLRPIVAFYLSKLAKVKMVFTYADDKAPSWATAYAGPFKEAQSPLRRNEAEQLQLRDNRRQTQPHRPGRQPLVSEGRDCCFHALQIRKCDGSDSGARARGEGKN